MSNFTPGPWNVLPLETGKRGAGGGYLIVDSNNIPFMGQLPQGQEANARLIAAAPELLEACKQALDLLEDIADASSYESLVNAINKAEGK